MTSRLRANAKINLNLYVSGVRPDGYHNIKSVMQSVSLSDMVSVTLGRRGGISVRCGVRDIPEDENNTAVKAAAAFFEAANIKNQGLEIAIKKNIPIQAGLGGASADGAAVLRGLNGLFGEPFGERALREIGAGVGADIPFCLAGGVCLCEGKGDVLTPLPPLPRCLFVIAKGESGVSTAEAYGKIDGLTASEAALYDFDAGAFSRSIEEIAGGCSNIFEAVTDLPDVAAIKGIMKNGGALCSRLSGSGAAVFGIFKDSGAARRCRNALEASGFWSRVCGPAF